MTKIGFVLNFRNTNTAEKKMMTETMFNAVTSVVKPPSPQKERIRIPIPAEAMSATMAGRKIANVSFTKERLRNRKYKNANSDTMIAEGMMQPIVATIPPAIPATCIPTNVAELIAIGPGVISAMVIRSVKSVIVSQPLASTTWLCMMGMAAYPPPMLNRPTCINTQRSSR